MNKYNQRVFLILLHFLGNENIGIEDKIIVKQAVVEFISVGLAVRVWGTSETNFVNICDIANIVKPENVIKFFRDDIKIVALLRLNCRRYGFCCWSRGGGLCQPS